MVIEQAALIGLAAWRLSALLAYEDGPLNMFARVRLLFSGRPPLGAPGVPEWCVWCLGPWMAAACYGLWELEPLAVVVIAASSVVVIVERWARP